MRDKIDHLVRNNTKILKLLEGYMGRARTKALKVQEEEFRKHATRYATRWQSMEKVALSGGEYPISEPVFPKGFPAAVNAELSEVQSEIDKMH